MMNKTSYFLAALLLLCTAYPAWSQSPASSISVAERSWPTFWRKFATAINKKDQAALLRVMPADFSDGGGGLSAKDWLQFIGENERNGSWRHLQQSMAGGAKINRTWSAKGIPTKVTRDNGYYFEYRRDGKWYFAGVVGD